MAGPWIGLTGGLTAAVIESLLNKRELLSLGAVRLWAEAFGFSLITHVVFGLIVCVAASLCGALVVMCVRRLDGRLRPLPLALAGLLTGEAVMLAYWLVWLAGIDPIDVPDGARGLALAALVWLVGLVPIGLTCLVVGKTILGRLARTLARLAVWPAAALLMIAAGVTWLGRPHPQSADGFWPPPSTAPSRGQRGRPPDIVLIVGDALRVDRLGCYGYPRPTSPHVDAFAADAAVFETAVSSAAWTVPSHASIFTGLYVSQHAASFARQLWLEDRFVTLAEVLRDRGYQTMALSNNRIVAPATNLTQGFERFIEPAKLGLTWGVNQHAFYVHVLHKLNHLGPLFARWFAYDAGGHATTDLVARCLRGRDHSKPFFLFINLMETHDPYDPPLAYRRGFVRAEDLNRSYGIDQSNAAVWRYVLDVRPVFGRHDVEILSDLYDGRVRELDDRFADLMRVLATEVRLDEMVIVLTADHGEHLGEHGLLGHQFSIHNELIHVPLIVRWPKVLRPQRVRRCVQTLDLFPTLLAWAGAQPRQAAKVMARSLTADPTPASGESSRNAYAEYLCWSASPLKTMQRLDATFDPSRWEVAFRAILNDQWKLVIRTDGKLELYDMTSDSGEERNVEALRPRMAKLLADQYHRWTGSFERFDPNRRPAPLAPDVEREQRQRLRDLGYVQ